MTQPADHRPALMAGHVVPDQDQAQRRIGVDTGQFLAALPPVRDEGRRVSRSGHRRGHGAQDLGQCVPQPGMEDLIGRGAHPFRADIPRAGRKRVSNVAVPPRAYSCGCRCGTPCGRQLAPSWGIA